MIHLNKKLKHAILENIILVAIAVIFFLGIRSTVAQAMIVTSGSMLPTMQLQDRVIVEKISYKVEGIKRGDIVVFRPLDYLQKEGPDWVKRVVGLPGETVEVRDGEVYINQQPLTESYEMEKPAYDFGPIIIPERAYFVLGDNRNGSFDSHDWGVLPEENIVGKPLLKYWPLARFGPFSSVCR